MRRLFTLAAIVVCGHSMATGIHVGKGRAISTLRQGISLAKDGDTVYLYPGIYKEGNVIITRQVHLIGVGRPVLDGENKNEMLTVSGKNIRVTGLHFANAGYSSMNDFAGLKIIDASAVLIDNNLFTNTYFAIHIANSVHSTIRNNRLIGNNKSEHLSGNGIHLWKCSNMLIENNNISAHRDGIYFEFVTNSIIKRNHSEKNIRYGLHFMFSNDDSYEQNVFRNNGAGVAVMYSKKVRMHNNYFDQNWGPSAYGILLKDISDGEIWDNHFVKNTVGIHMEGSSRIELKRNSFNSNGWAIKMQASCDQNNFHHNNFHGNSFDIATNGTMMLNKFYNNYWDKYEGYDINKDGFGDVPYHPVSMYAMIVEQNPSTLIMMRSFILSLLDKAEKAIPSLTPADLFDSSPMLKPNKL